MPEAHEDVLERFACCHLENSDVECERDTWLPLSHILTEGLGTWPDILRLVSTFSVAMTKRNMQVPR